jgi:hypothetical protein
VELYQKSTYGEYMSTQISGVSSASLPTASSSTVNQTSTGGESEFQQLLQTMLQADSNGKVNEEQLFSAIINERLTSNVGEDAAERYRQLFTEMQEDMTRADGYVPVEAAANQALNGLVAEGVISGEEAGTIQGQAFTAAQLDDKMGTLYDSQGSTVAVMLVNLALETAESTLNELDDGTISANSSQDDVEGAGESAETQGTFIGGDGFLYKPVSESNGNLVILLPAYMQGEVTSVELLDSEGNSIESGDSSGPYEDGRPLFRFNDAGSGYPDNMTVQVQLASGEVKEYTIPDSAKRWE